MYNLLLCDKYPILNIHVVQPNTCSIKVPGLTGKFGWLNKQASELQRW